MSLWLKLFCLMSSKTLFNNITATFSNLTDMLSPRMKEGKEKENKQLTLIASNFSNKKKKKRKRKLCNCFHVIVTSHVCSSRHVARHSVCVYENIDGLDSSLAVARWQQQPHQPIMSHVSSSPAPLYMLCLLLTAVACL